MNIVAPETNSPDLLRVLQEGSAGLSDTQRRIAELILADPEWAVQTAVEAFAVRAGVSAPTIVRLARAIGCEGVRDMKLRLAGSLARGTPYLHRSVRPTDGPAEVVRNVVGSVTSMVAEWQNGIDSAAVAQATDAIDGARCVDCHGTGATSYILAQDLHARLFRLGLTTTRSPMRTCNWLRPPACLQPTSWWRFPSLAACPPYCRQCVSRVDREPKSSR